MPYVSRGSKATRQIKNNPRAKKNTPKTVENVVFLHRALCPLGPRKNEILWLTENLGNQWKKHGFQPAELAARNSNPEKSPAHAKEPR